MTFFYFFTHADIAPYPDNFIYLPKSKDFVIITYCELFQQIKQK